MPSVAKERGRSPTLGYYSRGIPRSHSTADRVKRHSTYGFNGECSRVGTLVNSAAKVRRADVSIEVSRTLGRSAVCLTGPRTEPLARLCGGTQADPQARCRTGRMADERPRSWRQCSTGQTMSRCQQWPTFLIAPALVGCLYMLGVQLCVARVMRLINESSSDNSSAEAAASTRAHVRESDRAKGSVGEIDML